MLGPVNSNFTQSRFQVKSFTKLPNKAQSSGPTESFVPSTPQQTDLSGFTRFGNNKLLAVRDTKLEDDGDRVLLYDPQNSTSKSVPIDWSKTGRSRDLEAIAPGRSQGDYLAVEGSSFGENKARLFELKVGEDSGSAEKSHVLPDFGQEIEGLVSIDRGQGRQTLLFAGRGGDGQDPKIYWGDLTPEGLSFEPKGLKGKAVEAPFLGKGQRGLAELTADEKGRLWASATIDEGDTGPFHSSVYQVGHLTPNSSTPFRRKAGESFPVAGVKVEALSFTAQGTLFIGSDDEALGGKVGSLGLG